MLIWRFNGFSIGAAWKMKVRRAFVFFFLAQKVDHLVNLQSPGIYILQSETEISETGIMHFQSHAA